MTAAAIDPSISTTGTSSSVPDDLPELAHRQMAFRAERLARVYRLAPDQVDDLRQELAAEIVRALRRFDPAIASRTTFTRAVMDFWYRQKCKQLSREASARYRILPLPPLGTEGFDYADPRDSGFGDVDLRLDLVDRMGALPQDLFEIARDLLAGKSVPGIAAERGVHRGTVNRLVLRLRTHLADFDPNAN